MKTTAVHALTIAAVLAGSLGCQSGPRWAWWKHDKAPEDTSLVARSAEAPALPSAQSTPQAIAAAGLQPAAPPSSANLAAAGTVAAPGIQIPITSPATIANAPMANYPSINSTTNTMATAPAAASPAAIAIPPMTTGTMPQQVAAANVPANGPYDPSGYRPAAGTSPAPTVSAGETSPPSADRYQIAAADRYGISPSTSDRVATESTRNYEGIAPAPATVSQAAGDRYGLAPPSHTAIPQASVAVSQPPSAPSSAATIPPSVPLATAPGSYRPGGTSSYVGSTPTQHVEVATRPAAPASVNVAPAQATTPAGTSVPWAPPAPAPATRTY